MPLCVEMYICSSGAANCFRVAAVVMDTDQVWLDESDHTCHQHLNTVEHDVDQANENDQT